MDRAEWLRFHGLVHLRPGGTGSCRLHRLLRDLRPGGAPTDLAAEDAAALLTAIRPVTVVEQERKAMARELIAGIRRLDRNLRVNRRRCAAAVAASGSTLSQIFGISDVLAAKILGHSGDITRFATAQHYATTPALLRSKPPAATSAFTGCVVRGAAR